MVKKKKRFKKCSPCQRSFQVKLFEAKVTLKLFLLLMDILHMLLQISNVAKPVATFTKAHFLCNLQIEQCIFEIKAGKQLS